MAEPELVVQSEQFEAAIRGGDRELLRAFCAAKQRALRCAQPRGRAGEGWVSGMQLWGIGTLDGVAIPD